MYEEVVIPTHHTWNEYQLSRLMLGTAQLGLAYGVANTTGRPDFRQAVRLIAAAAEGGVNCFDTAAAYGDSEVVLGRVLSELGLANSAVVVTKVRALRDEELGNPRQAAAAIEKSVDQSRQRLGLDCLPVVLFHREADAAYIDVLADLKRRGWLRFAGVSCDHQSETAHRLLAVEGVAAVQLPGSMLDRRHQQGGVLQAAAARGTPVFVRSVYLQGLLLMPEASVPEALRAVLPVRQALAAVVAASGIPLAELAVRYMLAQNGVACLVVGAETAEQVQENISMVQRGPLDADLVAAVDAAIVDLPEAVITPRLWRT
ncbi:MAG: aldo/keto reductase [Patescibacteria group bacterium]|nr:aldo/keto reductase [Patescibacteria group bacterium]